MPEFEELIEKAKDLASKHPDQVHKGLEKAEDLIEGKLGGKYGDQVEKTSDVVEGFLDVHQPDQGE
jgi:hypothetical protein